MPGALLAQLVRLAGRQTHLILGRMSPRNCAGPLDCCFLNISRGSEQVQSLPGALPAQLVRPTDGKVTWILDADAASQIAAEKWEEEKTKAFPRSNV